MAAAITTNSSTLEGQAGEILEALAIKQSSQTDNPNNIQVLTTYTRDMNSGVTTAALNLPTSATLDTTDGSVDISYTPVFA